MMFFYQTGIHLYGFGARVASLFSDKARKWVKGRKDWKASLRAKISDGNWIWFHCASLGEFEQGRKLMEEIRVKYPDYKLLLTFFSPSGYEIRKGYQGADHVCYMPLDTRSNVSSFLDIVQPKMVFIIKYELWLNYIFEAERRGIPMFLVSALVRESSKFLTSQLKGLYKKAFGAFSWIFTQDENSLKLLKAFAETDKLSVAGDTRFDRAAELPAKWEAVPGIAEFVGEKRCIVVGSPWPKDEAVVLPAIAALKDYDLKWIIAPHEIHPAEIDRHIRAYPGKMAKYSARDAITSETDVLWIDNVGMLSRLYKYSTLVYIGGGFGTAIHNTQEPAVYGNPVLFGPKFETFVEAVDMVQAGGAVSVQSTEEFVSAVKKWLDDPELLAQTRAQNTAYMQSMAGATEIVLRKLEAMQILP
ncbi:MAG: glycosyltransferase N-terminal domain-containing protein [Bacteroidota bacterium]